MKRLTQIRLVHKRTVKYTHKALEERLNRLIHLRKSKITIHMNEIDKLKENDARKSRTRSADKAHQIVSGMHGIK